MRGLLLVLPAEDLPSLRAKVLSGMLPSNEALAEHMEEYKQAVDGGRPPVACSECPTCAKAGQKTKPQDAAMITIRFNSTMQSDASDPLLRSFQAGGQPARAQIGGRSRCPWMTVSDHRFPPVLARTWHALADSVRGDLLPHPILARLLNCKNTKADITRQNIVTKTLRNQRMS